MRLALDARCLARPTRRGIGKAQAKLYQHLASVRPGWEVVGYHRGPEPMQGPSLPAGITKQRMVEMPGDRLDAWTRFRLPWAVKQDGADVLHCPANHAPGWMPVPTVVHLFDVIPLDMPEGLPAEEVTRFHATLKRAKDHAARVATSSHYTRDRLVADCGLDGDRIDVIPLGVTLDGLDSNGAGSDRIPQSVEGNAGRYVLHFGSGQPRKNTVRVIEAWARLPRDVRRDTTLLVLGLDPVSLSRFREVATMLGVQNQVDLKGFADEADIPSLLAGAEALCYPSLAEGYGLPILEAYAAGTAVITSDRGSLPEIAGDGACMLSPTDTDALAGALQSLLEDSGRQQRLIEAGWRELVRFAWDRGAEALARCFELAAGLATTDQPNEPHLAADSIRRAA